MFAIPPPGLVGPCVRGVRAGAARPDGLTDVQSSVIAAVAGQVFHTAVDPRTLEPIDPDELAASVTDPSLRHQLVAAMLGLSLMAHPPDPDGPARIAEYARTLGVGCSSPPATTWRATAAGCSRTSAATACCERWPSGRCASGGRSRCWSSSAR